MWLPSHRLDFGIEWNQKGIKEEKGSHDETESNKETQQ